MITHWKGKRLEDMDADDIRDALDWAKQEVDNAQKRTNDYIAETQRLHGVIKNMESKNGFPWGWFLFIFVMYLLVMSRPGA